VRRGDPGARQLTREFAVAEPADPFLRTLDAYAAAVRDKDVDAFAALYDADVHVFDMWGSWSIRGLPAWRAMAADWFASLGAETVAVTCDEAQSALSGELAIGHAVLTYTASAPDGTRLRALSNRATMALRRTGTAWTIVHEHTSAPIDHRSLQAILDRGPG
jgi:ketosteroid isomerase-like protein